MLLLISSLVLAAAVLTNGQGCHDCLDPPPPRPDADCGGRVTVGLNDTVTLRSPWFIYPYNKRCLWTVVGPPGKVLNITATSVNLRTGCSDHLDVDEHKLCGGTALPVVIVTRSPTASVRLTTFDGDDHDTPGGFWLEISAVDRRCGEDVTVGYASTSYIASIGFPRKYPARENCVYTINGPAGSSLLLDAITFETEADKDYLELSGPINGKWRVLGKFSGNNGPNQLHTFTDKLVARFASDSSVQRRGFNISLRVDNERSLVDASQLRSGSSRRVTRVPSTGNITFTSRGFSEGYYTNNLNSNETFSGPVGTALEFNTISFSLEWGDHLRFTEIVNGEVKWLGLFQHSTGPHLLRSTTNEVVANFRTNQDGSEGGFQISVKVNHCPGRTSCPNNETICLSWDQFCDGENQCPRGSDEQFCKCGQSVFKPELVDSAKIVGGFDAVANSWPWHVAVLGRAWDGDKPICGGSLIDRNWVLTSTQCCDYHGPYPSSYKVKVGTHDLSASESGSSVHGVKSLFFHPRNSYQGEERTFDYCLMELDTPAHYRRDVAPVCLGDGEDETVGAQCYVTGWGSTVGWTPSARSGSGGWLQQADVKIVDTTECNKQHKGLIDSSMICAASPGKDRCAGDTGGPLVCQRSSGEFALVGIVSWGKDCARPGFPGVYSRVSAAVPWIIETMQS